VRRSCQAVVAALALLLVAVPVASGERISAAPWGPAAPTGGWAVEYGDAFAKPICGTPGALWGDCDNTLYPNGTTSSCSDTHGFNFDEMEQFNCSHVALSPYGLDLWCSPKTGLPTHRGFATSRYLCGAVQGAGAQPRGYEFFRWRPGEGQEWAVQIVAQFPPNTGEADPGWWSSSTPWTEEIDFFEGFGAESGLDGTWCDSGLGSDGGYVGTTLPTWIYNTATDASIQAENNICDDLGFDPSVGFHVYTTVIYRDDGIAEYIDGKPDHWSYVPVGGRYYSAGSDIIGPPPYLSNAVMGLILSYALRDDVTGDPDLYYSSGTRNFLIRSIAVYEDARAKGANSFSPEVAPGTTVLGDTDPNHGWGRRADVR
jgi:hypothetical protein